MLLSWFLYSDFQNPFSLPTNRYGDMPAHNLLWRECEKSSDNVAARLAVIPLVQVISHSWDKGTVKSNLLMEWLFFEALYHALLLFL